MKMHIATKFLTRETIERAQKQTQSNLAAARYLHVSFPTYKKYAKLYKTEDGITLFDKHKNQSGSGIPKFLRNMPPELKGNRKAPGLMDLIEGRVPAYHFDPQKIKDRIIFEKLIEEKCGVCGFAEKRVFDLRSPLVLHHKDNNKGNYHLDNLEFHCYNCSFLYGTSIITDEQVKAEEHYIDKSDEFNNYEMDEYMLEHLKSLGLYQEKPKPGFKYVTRNLTKEEEQGENRSEI
jgi:hypothetical protein